MHTMSSAHARYGNRIVAVLVTHDRPQLLLEALQAVAGQTRRPSRLIVVDNGSDRATREVLAATPDIDVVRSDVNLGGAGGFALGIERAMALDADWIWLMDDDAIPDPRALEALQARLPDLPREVGAVCSSVMEFGVIATNHRRRFNGLVGFERPVAAAAYAADVLPVDTASFVGFLVSARAVREVGLPNPAFFLSYDDTEYSLRLGRHGFGVWLVPSSVIVHKRTRSSRLRATEFGPKHYFNVRNRIFVKSSYCRFGNIGAAAGALFGMALWLCSPGRFKSPAWHALLRALSDGYAARLGPLPERLKSSAVR